MIESQPQTPQPQRLVEVEALPLVALSDAAAAKLRELTLAENNPAIGLRVYVYSGGCSGFRYGMMLEDQPGAEDITVVSKGINVYVDQQSTQLPERIRDRLSRYADGRRLHGQQPQRRVRLRVRQQLPDRRLGGQCRLLLALDPEHTGASS